MPEIQPLISCQCCSRFQRTKEYPITPIATAMPANKWGMECVANLGQLPPFGATVFVGGPKIGGASGGPSRVIALV